MAYKRAFLSLTHTLVLDIGTAYLLRTYRVLKRILSYTYIEQHIIMVGSSFICCLQHDDFSIVICYSGGVLKVGLKFFSPVPNGFLCGFPRLSLKVSFSHVPQVTTYFFIFQVIVGRYKTKISIPSLPHSALLCKNAHRNDACLDSNCGSLGLEVTSVSTTYPQSLTFPKCGCLCKYLILVIVSSCYIAKTKSKLVPL